MADEFDRRWLALIASLTWVEAFYALIGLTRLGERPTTVERLAAVVSSAEAARGWLTNHPGGRVFPVAEMARSILQGWSPRDVGMLSCCAA
jgi:hypothetical protein